ncbi:MAG: class I SAM-dependent methyltransferase [Chloroflexota bacterium]|nr:class I SAM-dependent methyltransferase [Chloroflexota bacterium]
MNHQDHVNLLRGGVTRGIWADLGSGSGAFTLALADLLGGSGEIYSVDKNAGALREQERAMCARFPQAVVHYGVADFTRPLDLPPLDGIVMANALHFCRDQFHLVQSIKNYLRRGGRFILVEYNIDQGNPWVPFPLSCSNWETLARRCGFASTRLLATRPSSFLREIYSALSE